MGWIINTQEETRGKNKFDVKCKRIKFFPVEGKGGETHFKALGFVLLQIIVEDEKSGTLLKLKLNASKGVESPTFAIQHADKLERPTFIVGEGKKRREVPDMLRPLEKVKGEVERYNTLKEFEERISKFLGVLVAGEVLDLFAVRLGEIVQKRLAEEAAA
jgi:hypothetical protein